MQRRMVGTSPGVAGRRVYSSSAWGPVMSWQMGRPIVLWLGQPLYHSFPDPLADNPVLDIPTTLHEILGGRYVLKREIGRGGAATVYLAHDVRHERRRGTKTRDP